MADAVYKTSGRKGTQQNCDHLARLFAARGIAEHLVCLLIQVTESAICFGGRTTFVAAVYFRKKKIILIKMVICLRSVVFFTLEQHWLQFCRVAFTLEWMLLLERLNCSGYNEK